MLIGIIQRRWRDKTGRRGSDYRANRAICLQNLAYMFKIGGENKSNFCPHVMFIKGVCLVSNRMLSSVQFSSVAQSCPTLCDPMNRSTPGLPVHNHLPEITQTHVHQVRDAIHHLILCRPLLLWPPIPPSISLFQ